MTDYSIRHATHQTDGEALLPLARDAVDEAQGPYSTRRSGSDLPQSVFNSSVVFVAEDVGERRLIGFVALRIEDIADTPQSHAVRRADVTMLGVIPERRREGIGRALMERALQEAKGRGATLITLCVAEHNGSAIKLYENLGWQVIDRMMVFPQQVQATSPSAPVA
jgi:ribosomal protein S18 acetylase RimI-like enzyme